MCVETDSNGNAAVEVTSTLEGEVDVHANFYNEGVLRDDKVAFATAPKEHVGEGSVPPVKNPDEQSGGSVPAGAGTPGSSLTGTTSTTSGSTSSGTPSSTSRYVAPKGRKAIVSSARLVRHGKHYYLLARISASSRSVKIKLVLLSSSGKVLRTINAVVNTNKTIELAVPYSRKVANVKLTIG